MKRHTIICILVSLCTQSGLAQSSISYRPLAQEGRVWHCEREAFESVYNRMERRYEPVPFTRYYKYKVEGDTVINNLTYKKLLLNDGDFKDFYDNYEGSDYTFGYSDNEWHYVGALRDEEAKAFIIHEYYTTEELIYDLSMEKGDSLEQEYDVMIRISTSDIVVIHENIVLRCLAYTRRFPGGYLPTKHYYWIEGVGTHYDCFLPKRFCRTTPEAGMVLSCYEGNQCIFKSDDPRVSSVATPSLNSNPSTHHCYDLTGRRLSVPSTFSVRSVLPKGVYIEDGKKRVRK